MVVDLAVVDGDLVVVVLKSTTRLSCILVVVAHSERHVIKYILDEDRFYST